LNDLSDDNRTSTVERGAACGSSPKARKAADVALGLMGACTLAADAFADAVSWQNGGTALIGRDAIFKAVKRAEADIRIDEIVTHGKAAAVSGQVRRTGQPAALFCHMIRFTSASAKQVASVISFEHPVKERKT
jgi:hypothetical protein